MRISRAMSGIACVMISVLLVPVACAWAADGTSRFVRPVARMYEMKAPDTAAMTATAACESRLPISLIISLPGQVSTYVAASFDHLIGAREERRRQYKAER